MFKFNFDFTLKVVDPPKPYAFVSQSLQSSLLTDLSETVNSINQLMPQLTDFIAQFHSVVLENNIGIISDVNGNMSMDVPSTMSDSEGERLSQRIGIIDRVITTRGQEIDVLIQKGMAIEKKIKMSDPNFTSKILPKIQEFNRLNASYKH
jgi:hypothetical protein